MHQFCTIGVYLMSLFKKIYMLFNVINCFDTKNVDILKSQDLVLGYLNLFSGLDDTRSNE